MPELLTPRRYRAARTQPREATGAALSFADTVEDPLNAERHTPLSLRNPVYRPMEETRARYRIIYGGAGSSKSVSVAQSFLELARRSKHVRVLVLRKVYRTCRHSTFALFRDIIRAASVEAAVNKTEMTIAFPSGGDILHAGLDDLEKLKSIAGITHIWIEEGTELDFPVSEREEPDLAQVDLRLRGVDTSLRPSVTITFNPKLEAVKIFEYLNVNTTELPTRGHKHFENGNIYVQHTTYEDNPWVGSDYVSVFRKLGGVMQAVYERGELVAIDAPDQLIKYEWVKAAFERSREDAWTDGRGRMACDVARYGDDETTIGWGEGFYLAGAESYKGQDTTTTGRRFVSIGRERGIAAELATVDSVGLGSGAADTAHDEGYMATEFIAGASPVDSVPESKDDEGNITRPGLSSEQFNNLRSQAWWYYSRQMEAGTIAFASDLDSTIKRKLQEDLLAPRYRFGSEKRIEVEPKIGKSKNWGIKQRLGRSPDTGDMEVMRVFAEFVKPSSTLEFLGSI